MKQTKPVVSPLRFALYTLSFVFGAAAIVLAWHAVDQLLISDRRFRLQHDEEDPSGLRIDGLRHASRERVEEIFATDLGRSVFAFPLAERRRNLLAVDWVKDATVSRVWPNQVAVRVEERRPIAFLKQNADAVAMMIDDEGVVLRLQDTGRYKLPVVAGIQETDPQSDRRLRIRRMLRLQTEIGPHHFERLSEIDLADPENIKVTYPLTDRALVLYMGHGSYAKRLRNFLENLSTVLERYPTARTLDLRLDDRILVPGAVPAKTGEPRAE